MDKSRNLLIVGLARNVEEVLPREISRLSSVLSTFYGAVEFHIVESNSTDQTVLVLRELSSKIPGLSYECLGDLQRKIPDRIERLRYCRNRYIDFYRKNPKRYSEVMVVDFDIRNNRLKRDSIANVLNEGLDWDALFANQKGRYFDIYALREDKWCPGDCMAEVGELVEAGTSKEKAKEIAIWNRMKKIPRTSNLIKVDSAFGGLAIYKSWIFDQFDYSTEMTPIGPQESEHVALHYKVRSAGGNLYIHPRLNNFAWNPHNLSSFKALRRLDQLSDSALLQGFRSRFRRLLG